MREIILNPGASIEIDGVRVRAAEQGVSGGTTGGVYDPATDSLVPAAAAVEKVPDAATNKKVIWLREDHVEALRLAVTNWIARGDLSQAHLLRGAITEVAVNLSRFGEEIFEQSADPLSPSSPSPAPGKHE